MDYNQVFLVYILRLKNKQKNLMWQHLIGRCKYKVLYLILIIYSLTNVKSVNVGTK